MIIGFSGKKQSGKNTAADYLTERHGFEQIAFAGPLYDMVFILNPIIEVEVELDIEYGCCEECSPYPVTTNTTEIRLADLVERIGWDQAKTRYPEVRRTLQVLGTDCVRKYDSDFWVNAAARAVDRLYDEGITDVAITDVRFPNEAEFVNAVGSVVRIERSRFDDNDQHASEISLDGWDFDYVIENNGTRQELYQKVDDLLIAVRSGTILL